MLLLQPENILYKTKDPDSVIKLSDFGLSKVIEKKKMMETCCGTPQYVAPEVLNYSGYGPEVDMWSMGVLLYILLCGFPPFYDENDAALFAQIQSGDFEFISPYWDPISPEAKDLVTRLLHIDPKKRLTVSQALAHPWFTATLSATQLKSAQAKMKSLVRGKWKAAGVAILMSLKAKKKL